MATPTKNHKIHLRQLGQQDYAPVWDQMRAFTDGRDRDTKDEIWLVEHTPVYTLGQAGKPEHLLNPGEIPVIKTDRGGQVTYHGPGQLVCYVLLDLRRANLGVRQLVSLIEQSIVDLLAGYGIDAETRPDAPGVYINGSKIASLGLRVRRGCSFHGLSFNVDMDLEPFSRINPCGFPGLQVTQLAELGGPTDMETVAADLVGHISRRLGYTLMNDTTPAQHLARQ